ncbi:SH3 domain-containing protein [Blautia sp. OF03-15BH]|nr:SH3 domain-containing protein [Blautia sp. OF03-15BH]
MLSLLAIQQDMRYNKLSITTRKKGRNRMDDFREWLSDNLRYFLLGFAILAVVIIAVVGIRIYQRVAGSQKKPTDNIRVESESTSTAGETEAVTERTSESEKKVVSSEKETEAETKAAEAKETEKETEAKIAEETETETSETHASETQATETAVTETAATEAVRDPGYLKTTVTLNLRTEPDGTVINSYAAGRIVKFLGKEGSWYKVLVGGREGYMSSDYLQEVPYEAGMENEVETEPQTEAPAPIYKTLKGACYLRAETSKESQILGTYMAGTTVQFLEDVGGWYKVSVDGMTGYMGAQFF